jgi:hypothetical protein
MMKFPIANNGANESKYLVDDFNVSKRERKT